jgi:hypothetical protein
MSKYYSYGDYGRSAGYRYGSYASSYKKKSYSSWDDDFSWGNWGNWKAADEDDDKDLYIKAHDGYFTPKAQDIEHQLTYHDSTKNNKSLIKEMSRYFFYRMIDEKDYFDEKYADETKISEEELPAFQKKQEFYDGLWDKFIPGDTPLEKAIAVFKQFKEEQKKQKGKDKGDIDPSKLVSGGIEFHEEIYNDPEYNELLDTNAFSKNIKADILNKISLIRNLGSQFKVEKEIEEKIVSNSSIISKKIMRDYSQMGMLDLYQKMLPTFNLKMLTKDLIVNVPVDKTEHKQKIIMLLDFSGSMSYEEKQEWVTAILVDRLRYAMKEEADIYFSYFVDDPDDLHFTHIYNRETALKFWNTFSHCPNGGDTALGDMVNRIKMEIEEGKLMNLNIDLREDKPEILAINDGQDSVKTNGFVYKTNAISVIDGPNTDLQKLCVSNQGKYVHVNGKEAKTWSTDGQQTMQV